jgi:hypothetical protein
LDVQILLALAHHRLAHAVDFERLSPRPILSQAFLSLIFALFIMRLPKNFKTRPMIGAATMIDLKQKYDASTVAVMRQALNEVVTDRRFLVRKSGTTLEVAEHILQQAASGERDLNRLKSAAFAKLSAAA